VASRNRCLKLHHDSNDVPLLPVVAIDRIDCGIASMRVARRHSARVAGAGEAIRAIIRATSAARGPIEDNSFLIEEAYNQEAVWSSISALLRCSAERARGFTLSRRSGRSLASGTSLATQCRSSQPVGAREAASAMSHSTTATK